MFGRIKVQTWLILGILHGYVAIPLLLFSWRGCSSHLFATVLWIFVFQFFIHIAGTRVLCQKVVSCVAAYFIVALLHFFVQCLMISFSLVVVLMVEGFCSSKDDVWSSAIVTCRTVSITDKVSKAIHVVTNVRMKVIIRPPQKKKRI